MGFDLGVMSEQIRSRRWRAVWMVCRKWCFGRDDTHALAEIPQLLVV